MHLQWLIIWRYDRRSYDSNLSNCNLPENSFNEIRTLPGGAFLQKPGTFSVPKANFKKNQKIVPQFLTHKPVNLASLTDGFVLNFDLGCKRGKHKAAFRARKVNGTFKKQAPGDTMPNQSGYEQTQ